MHYFSRLFKKLNKPCVNFFRIWRQNAIYWIFEKISKILGKFLKKIEKLDYFCKFLTKFKKPCVNYLRVWTIKTIYWKFWENFRKFWNIFFIKMLKCIIVAYFSNKLTNYALIFARLDEKHKLLEDFENILKFFDENS